MASIGPNKYSLSELIKAAKQDKENIQEDQSNVLNEAQKFIVALDIKDGKNKVLSSFLYKVYTKWVNKPLNKVAFFQQFSEIFGSLEDGRHRRYYNLNYKPIQLLKQVEKIRPKYE